MLSASDIKNGMILRIEKNLYKVVVVEYHMGGGTMGGIVHVKLKDIQSGLFLDRKLKPEEKVELVDLDRRTLEFLYKDSDGYYMMDPESFEQIQLGKHFLGTFDPFFQPNMKLPVEFVGEEPVNVIFPEWVELKVVSTVPSIRVWGQTFKIRLTIISNWVE
jgi:elongation factor P